MLTYSLKTQISTQILGFSKPLLISGNLVTGLTVSNLKALTSKWLQVHKHFQTYYLVTYAQIYVRCCPKYLPYEYSSRVSTRYEKYFPSYRTNKLSHTSRQTDKPTDGETGACDNIPPTFGATCKKTSWYQRKCMCVYVCCVCVCVCVCVWGGGGGGGGEGLTGYYIMIYMKKDISTQQNNSFSTQPIREMGMVSS